MVRGCLTDGGEPMLRSRSLWRGAALTGAVLLMATVAAPIAAAAPPGGFTVRTMYFAVSTGPGGEQPCTIIGDLYTPAGLDTDHRAPAVLTTNGFGGSKDSQAPQARMLAALGYVVLAYSGLGFGGSSCKITLDDPDFDGRAAAQLVGFLGGRNGIAFADAELTRPEPALAVVRRDAVDHAGGSDPHDPRVGMVGGSYGGGAQFAAAAVDPRIDTIIPMITWNDLSYSLTPNSVATGPGVGSDVPGATKLLWAGGFFAIGVRNPGVVGYADDPSRAAGCPNFAPWTCQTFAEAAGQGFIGPAGTAGLRHASVTSFVNRIRIPVLLAQGQQDTLFNLNEATATFTALKAQGTPVKMIWHSWGHSNLTPAPGEFSSTAPDPATQYETARVQNWLDHYLKDLPTDTGPTFSYFRDWVDYTGIATPAYADSASFPASSPHSLYLSGAGTLVASASAVVPGAQSLFTGPAGLPTGLEPPDVRPGADTAQVNIPGTVATWTSAPMAAPLNVVGAPELVVRVAAPGEAVVFARLYDVAPDGTATLINGQVAPARIPNGSGPITITMPGIVHQFPPGHSLRLEVAGGDVSFRGGLTPTQVTVVSGPDQTLRLPVAG